MALGYRDSKPLEDALEMAPLPGMPNCHLVFCFYLSTAEQVTFADSDLGPLDSVEDRLADDRFKDRSTDCPRHFVGIGNEPNNDPALPCRQGRRARELL